MGFAGSLWNKSLGFKQLLSSGQEFPWIVEVVDEDSGIINLC